MSKLGRSIQDNQYVGGMKYSHFINLAILKTFIQTISISTRHFERNFD